MNDRQPLNPDALRLEAGSGGLASYPPVEKWDDWVEYDTAQWPRKVEKHCQIIPTICFNCEAACGLLGFVEKDTHRIRRFEGNPEHPGSRGRNCAKGPATLNQVTDPERIRYPLKRIGKRGEGKWERATWDEVLDDIAARVRKALQEERRNEIMYHVGRPGHELLYHQRILHSWGIDGHNSHTNVCSAGARAGYAFWSASTKRHMPARAPAEANVGVACGRRFPRNEGSAENRELMTRPADVIHDLVAPFFLKRFTHARRDVVDYFVPGRTFPFAFAALAMLKRIAKSFGVGYLIEGRRSFGAISPRLPGCSGLPSKRRMRCVSFSTKPNRPQAASQLKQMVGMIRQCFSILRGHWAVSYSTHRSIFPRADNLPFRRSRLPSATRPD